MFENVRLVLIGAAAILDAALLVALLDRRNYQWTPAAIRPLIFGGLLWHVGVFVELLTEETVGPGAWLVHWLTRTAMVSGLLLMPSAMWNGVLHFEDYVKRRPPRRLWHRLAYLPMLGAPPAAILFAIHPSGDFLGPLAPAIRPYLIWLALVNLVAAWKFRRLGRRLADPGARPFYRSVSFALAGMTATILLVFLLGPGAGTESKPVWFLVIVLAPVPLALIFIYFVLSQDLARLALRRSLIYGTVALAFWLFHRVVLEEMLTNASDKYHVNLHIVEGFIVTALVLCYQPLRRRAGEALGYLMGSNATRFRERTWKLAVEMSSRTDQPPEETLAWFAAAIETALEVEYVGCWLLDAQDQPTVRAGATDRLTDGQVVALRDALRGDKVAFFTVEGPPAKPLLELLLSARATLAALLSENDLSGVLLVGRRPRNRELGHEETSALLVLVEQLCVTMNASRARADRLVAERRAMLQEKLSTLGLVASSIAHEIKNPLSSIRTIAAVMAESLGSGSEHAEDLRLILSEVDRLAATTGQLLRFVRPALENLPAGSVVEVILGTVRIARHQAANRGVLLETTVDPDLPMARGDENSLREIFLNLVSNAIEAMPDGGKVVIHCKREGDQIVTSVIDDGPGVPESIRARLFEPFITGKETGTGLGLYVVGRRTRELGGSVTLETVAGSGSRFEVRLPIAAEPILEVSQKLKPILL